MPKSTQYRRALTRLEKWDGYLLQHSGLPGPRANIELALVVAEIGDAQLFRRYLEFGPSRAPSNSKYEFLAFCGAVGLGQLVAAGQRRPLRLLQKLASDPRWRIREGVAIALQQWGRQDMGALLEAMEEWSSGSPYVQRAAAAALCEPTLLNYEVQVSRVLDVLAKITKSIPTNTNRKDEGFIALKKGLAYCWSVAVAALPEEGKLEMEVWFSSTDPDIRWIMRENLKKDRLLRMDAEWVKRAWIS